MGSGLCRQGPTLVNDDDGAVEALLDLHCGAGVAGSVLIGHQLQCVAVEPHGVVPGHGADVLEAQDGIEAEAVWELAVC